MKFGYILISFDEDRQRMYYDGQCYCEKYFIPRDVNSNDFKKILKKVIKHIINGDDDDDDIKEGRKIIKRIMKLFEDEGEGSDGLFAALDALSNIRFKYHKFHFFQDDDVVDVLSFLTHSHQTWQY